jgi:hypothetical protein
MRSACCHKEKEESITHATTGWVVEEGGSGDENQAFF